MASSATAGSAQSSATNQQKILRIGVIQAGKIVEEKLVRRRESVTIGSSPRNTIVVPASSLPRTMPLFEMHGGQYGLIYNEAMDGRVSVNNQVLALDQVRQQNLGQPKGKGFARLALSDTSRGKLVLGEITLLFQFVAPPPIQPRPQLPPSIRGGLINSMDWTFASSFAAVAVIHVAFMLYVNTIDIKAGVDADVIPDDFAEYVPTVDVPKAIDLKKLSEAGEKKAEKVEKVEAPSKKAGGNQQKSKKPAEACDADCQARKAEERRAKLAAQVARLGALKLLGSKGPGGTAADLMRDGDPGSKLDSAFNGIAGVKFGKAGAGGLRPRGGAGGGSSVGIGDLGGRVGGPGEVGTGGMVDEKVPKAIVKAQHTVDSGTMSEDAVGRIIRQGMAAIRACYQRALKRNPKLSGKVDVRININALGKVTAVSIESDSLNDPSVSECIKGFASRWRFPPPEGGPAEVAVPFVFQSAE